MQISQIDGDILRKMVINAAKHLEDNKQYIDRLNVFPVPDGDTGTNMSLTLLSAAEQLAQMSDIDIYSVCKTLRNASLRGARGNSGVILSQLIRGFTKKILDSEIVNGKIFALACKAGADTAYKSVMKPTEGTILTVAKESSLKAIELSKKTDNIITIIEETLEYARQVLDKTPDMLPILKEADVVDAGGMGYVIALEGALKALYGDQDTEINLINIDVKKEKREKEDLKYKYCTEFIVLKNIDKFNESIANKFKLDLEYEGNSLMVLDEDDIIKVHIHTNNPGKILQCALKIGEIDDIKIDNMSQQISKDKSVKTAKEYGFISVAKGEGIIKIFKDLGVDKIIEGGQTMNPSIADILKAISDIDAENIFILPNNKNIILAANQVKNISEKNVYVIPSKDVTHGISSLINFDYNDTPDNNYNNIVDYLKNVKTGSVTYAVRDSKYNGNSIKNGDYIGMHDGNIKCVGNDINEICLKIVNELVDEDSEIITIYYGKDVEKEDAKKLANELEDRYPDCDVEIYNGGQPIYYYYLSVG